MKYAALVLVVVAVLLGPGCESEPPGPKTYRVEIAEDFQALAAIVAAGDTLVIINAPGLLPCLAYVDQEGWTVLPSGSEPDSLTWAEPDCGLDLVDAYLFEIRGVTDDPRLVYWFSEEFRADVGLRVWAITDTGLAGAPSAWSYVSPRWADVDFDAGSCAQ